MKYLSVEKLDPHFNGRNIVSTWGNPDTIVAKPDIDFIGLRFAQNGKSVMIHCSAKDLFKWATLRLLRDVRYGSYRVYARLYSFLKRLKRGVLGGH